MLEALLLGELLRDGGRLGDRLRRRLARRLVPPLRAADGRGGGGGRGIVEIYNCSLVRQKWSHEIGQIAFLVNGSQEWRSQAENTDGMERPKLLVHIELLPHVAPPFLDV